MATLLCGCADAETAARQETPAVTEAAEPALPDAPYRQLEHTLGLYTCGPSEFAYAVSSAEDVASYLAELHEKCVGRQHPDAWKDEYLAKLKSEGVDFERESLVFVQKVFGSGMINARLDFALSADGTLRATVTPIIPDPPLTPDIAIRKFAFAVDRSQVRRVVVLLAEKELATFDFR
jgi:hypothetical protein